ncbi:MAG: Ig-like domain-containing protein [Deinococcota bacterium]|nr:Ig-like domain-containing protein [Deinococcota bacterium]
MKRTLWILLLALALSACQQPSSVLSWVSPTQGSTLTGTVTLTVRAQGDRADAVKRVVFYADDKELGSVTPDDGTFTLTWDTARVEPDDYRLRAVPYGGPGITQLVTVVRGGGSGVVTTPTEPDAGGEGESGNDEDPLKLGGIIDLWPGGAQSPVGEAALNMPPGFPWGSLYPAEALRAQARALFSPAQAAETVKLPRGSYAYNEELQAWEGTPTEAGGIQIEFSYPDPETGGTHNIQINLIWDKYAPTTFVTGPNGDIEVPQGAWFFVQDNEEDILNLDIEAAWFTPESCAGPTLFPETLTLTGWINSPRPVDTEPEVTPAQEEDDPAEAPESTLKSTDLLLELSLEDTNRRENPYTLTSSLEMGALTEKGFEVLLSWIFTLVGDVSFEGCVVAGASLGEIDLYTDAMIGPEAGPYRGSSLNMTLFELDYNEDSVPVAGELEAELTSFDEVVGEEDTTTAEAALAFNEQDGFTAEGQVTLPDGSTMSVGEYVQMIIDLYTERALEQAPVGGG